MAGSIWEPPTTVPKPRPVRTAESCLWGTPAGQVTASKRFRWSQAQTDVFQCFIRDAYPNHKSCDLAPLLRALDLDGYNAIRNQRDESVYQLIVEKVRRKVGNTERVMRDRGVPLGSHAGIKSEPPLAATPSAPAIDRAEPTTVKKEAPGDGSTLTLSSISHTTARATTVQVAFRDRLYKESKAPSLGLQNRGTLTLFGASNSDATSPTTHPRSNDSVPRAEQHRAPLKQPQPLSNQGKPTPPKEGKPAPLKEGKPEPLKKEKPEPHAAETIADESLRKRQLKREGLVSRMDETLTDFGEELLDAHQAPEETDEWYEVVDAMKQMYELLQSGIRKLKKLEPLKE